jgi:hypothetical protein
VGTPEAIIAGIRRYAEVGSQYLTFHMPDASEITPIRLLGETVVPAVAGFEGSVSPLEAVSESEGWSPPLDSTGSVPASGAL